MKITKQYLNQIIKEELQKELQKEGLMDFFGGSSLKKDWQALVQKLYPKLQSQEDLTPQEVAEVLRYNFDPSQIKAGMGNEKGLLSISPKGKMTAPSQYISQMSPQILNKVLDTLEIPNTIYHLMTAKAKNPKLIDEIYEMEFQFDKSKRKYERDAKSRALSQKYDSEAANNAAALKYDQDQTAAKEAAAERAALEKARKEQEEEEASSTKNSRAGYWRGRAQQPR